MAPDLYSLTRKLIDIPSVSGSEGKVGDYLFELLSKDYEVERQLIAPERFNIIATAGEAPSVFLSTHMDTVPPYIESSEDDAYIYGRGACDAKGIIAAQIVAAQRLREEGLTGIGMLFTVDEELGSLGARAANGHPAASGCRYIINGEPTDNLLALGSKGSLRLRLSVEGKASHSAYPENGRSAIEPLLDVLNDIRSADWPEDEFFGTTTCNIGVVNGGTRPNIIPAEAFAELQIRLVTDSSVIKAMLERIVDHRAKIEYLSAAEPVRMLNVEGFESIVVRFTTDIPYLANWGTPLLLGPGSILVAHTGAEKVSKRDLDDSVDLYCRLVRSLSSMQ